MGLGKCNGFYRMKTGVFIKFVIKTSSTRELHDRHLVSCPMSHNDEENILLLFVGCAQQFPHCSHIHIKQGGLGI